MSKLQQNLKYIRMKNLIVLFVFLAFMACTSQEPKEVASAKSPELKTTLTKAELTDKIKGGWAGQVIGCTFGGPTEFKFKGSMIND